MLNITLEKDISLSITSRRERTFKKRKEREREKGRFFPLNSNDQKLVVVCEIRSCDKPKKAEEGEGKTIILPPFSLIRRLFDREHKKCTLFILYIQDIRERESFCLSFSSSNFPNQFDKNNYFPSLFSLSSLLSFNFD